MVVTLKRRSSKLYKRLVKAWVTCFLIGIAIILGSYDVLYGVVFLVASIFISIMMLSVFKPNNKAVPLSKLKWGIHQKSKRYVEYQADAMLPGQTTRVKFPYSKVGTMVLLSFLTIWFIGIVTHPNAYPLLIFGAGMIYLYIMGFFLHGAFGKQDLVVWELKKK